MKTSERGVRYELTTDEAPGDQPYGQLEIALEGGDPQTAIARLRAEGVEVEVVS